MNLSPDEIQSLPTKRIPRPHPLIHWRRDREPPRSSRCYPCRQGTDASSPLQRPPLYDLCTSPEIVQRIVSLLGPDIMLWSSNFFVKQPCSCETLWHQDQNNGGPSVLEPPLNTSIWMALDDCLIENSCIKFVAGSHLTTVNHEPPSDGHYFGLADTSSFDLDSAINMELCKGEFVIFIDRVLDAAEPYTSDKRRAGIAMRFTTPFVKILRPVTGMIVSGEDRFGFNDIVTPPSVS